MSSCQFSSRIAGLADGALSQEEISELDRHLEGCRVCESELETIQALDALYREHSFFEPAEEYWDELPRRVSAQLGSRRRHITPKWRLALADMAASWRWQHAAVAVSAAVLIALFFQKQMTFQPPAETTRPVVEVLPEASHAIPPLPPETRPERTEPVTQQKAIAPRAIAENTVPPAEQNIEAPAESRVVTLDSPGKIAGRGLKLGPIAFAGPKVLVPRPHAGFLVSSDADLSSSERRGDDVKIFSQEANRASLGSAGHSESRAIFPEIESDFQETLWIVQNSTDLSEKRNIWLSFLKREKDPTDHARGVYRLALVLEEIAHRSAEAAEARAAVSFYRDNAVTLRRFMHDSGFEKKLAALVAAAGM